MDSGQAGLLLAIIVLIVFSAFFSASETSFTSVNKVRLLNMEDQGNKRASAVLKMSENYDKLLSTILVGNNIVNILATSLSSVLFASLIINNASLATTVSTVVMTITVLIFGEITPKMLAKMRPESVAMAFCPILKFFSVVLFPITIIFSGWKALIGKIFKTERTATVTEGELITIVETAESEGELKEHESQLIRSAIEFEDLDVKDIMIPRVNVVAVDDSSDMDAIYNKFTESGYSRIPVFHETIDSVIGIIHEKDFYAILHDGGNSVKDIIQPSVCVSDSMKISTVLRMLQKAKVHMAIVIDEFGGTEGIVTLEDILEELVGEIYDEHDEVEELFRPQPDGSFLVSGNENVDEMYEKLELDPPEDIDSTTVSGYVVELMDKIPVVGESVENDSLRFEVTKATAKHVHEVRVTFIKKDDEEQKEE